MKTLDSAKAARNITTEILSALINNKRMLDKKIKKAQDNSEPFSHLIDIKLGVIEMITRMEPVLCDLDETIETFQPTIPAKEAKFPTYDRLMKEMYGLDDGNN